MPDISVVVPVYNSESYIQPCLDSIRSQTFRGFELLMIDDGSTDKSGLYCDEYACQDKRSIVIHQKNAGQSTARNMGIGLSRASWVNFIDSDDFIHPQMLELLYDAVNRSRAKMSICGAYMGRVDEFPPFSKITNPDYKPHIVDEDFFLQMVSGNWAEKGFHNQVVWSKLISTDIVRAIPFPDGHICEDNAIVCRWFGAAYEVTECCEKLYYYNDNPFGTMNTVSFKRRLDELWSLEEMELFYKSLKYKEMEHHVQQLYCQNAKQVEELLISQDADFLLSKKVRNMRKQKYWKNFVWWNMSLRNKIVFGIETSSI